MAKYFDVEQAIADGGDPQEIDAFMKANNLVPKPKVTQPVTPQPPAPIVQEQAPMSTPTQPDIWSKAASGLIDIGKRVVTPFARVGKNAIATSIQAPALLEQAVAENAKNLPLPDIVKEGLNTFTENKEKERKALEKIGWTEKEFQNAPEETKQRIIQQLKDTANIGSYAVPFGKGTNFVTKATLPGIGSGVLQGLSEDKVTPEGVVRSGLIGGAGATAVHAVTQIPSFIKRLGGTEEAAGSAIRSGTRKIKVKASIWGSGKENEINKTLDDLGFTGTADQQYAQLEPKMGQLEDKLQSFIDANPDIKVPKADIITAFRKNLSSAIRSREMNNTQARSEAIGYLKDLVKASGGTGQFTDLDIGKLLDMKRMINEDMQPIMKIVENGGVLSPRQKVILASWDSIDAAIKNVAPEVKTILAQQSNLYKAASSLSSARFNPPTFRAFGTSVPGAVTQAAADTGGKILQSTGKMTSKVGGVLPDIAGPTADFIGSRLPAVIPVSQQPANNPENPIQSEQNNAQSYNPSGQTDHTTSISQGSEPSPPAQPPVTGHTQEEWLGAISRATMAGDKAAVDAMEGQLSLQKQADAVAKAQIPKTPTLLQQIAQGGAKQAIPIIDKIEKELTINTPATDIGGYGFRPGLQAEGLLPWHTDTFDTDHRKLLTALRRVRAIKGAGNEVSDKQLEKELPQRGDTNEVVRSKLANLRDEMTFIYNAPAASAEYATDTTLPDITGGGI